MGDSSKTSVISTAILFMFLMLVINEVVLSVFSQIKSKFPIMKYIQNTSMTTILGILAGIILQYSGGEEILNESKEGFSEIFMIVLLPPIIFESALNMKHQLFFKNIGTILMYAIFGTLIACSVTAIFTWICGLLYISNSLDLISCFAFGSIISATDPVAILAIFKELGVDPTLNSIIYGESIMNDAVSIILFQTAKNIYETRSIYSEIKILYLSIFDFIGVLLISILIGFFTGIITAYILKQEFRQENTIDRDDRELSVLLLTPWLSYLMAEGLSMSGIVSIIFCGITIAHYGIPNLSSQGKKVIQKLYHTLAYNFENLLFLFIGISAFGFNLNYDKMGLMLFLMTFIIIIFARWCNIVFITKILNTYRKKQITKDMIFVLQYSGLRGAMAFALALKSTTIYTERDQGNMILTICILHSLFNILIQAPLFLPVMHFYDVQVTEQITHQYFRENYQKDQSEEQIEQQMQSGCFNAFKQLIGKLDRFCLRRLLVTPSLEINSSKLDFIPNLNDSRQDNIQTNNKNNLRQSLFPNQYSYEAQINQNQNQSQIEENQSFYSVKTDMQLHLNHDKINQSDKFNHNNKPNDNDQSQHKDKLNNDDKSNVNEQI